MHKRAAAMPRATLRRCGTRWSTEVLLLVLGFVCVSSGFVLPPAKSTCLRVDDQWTAEQQRASVLFLAKGGKRSKSNVGGGKNKKSNKKSNNKSLHEKEVTRASQRASVVLPGIKSRAPPWQVLSPKDAERNVEKEKRRRARIKEGLGEETMEFEQDEQLKAKALMSDANRQLLKWKRFNPTSVPCGMSFIGSYLDKRLPPRLGVPEVAFLGRSNVGKSSLLNRLSASALASSKYASDEARVGKTPGATASVNLYAMLGKVKNNLDVTKPILGLVDLPGFGYAKLSKDVQEAVQLAAERYLGRREELALGILLVDARREPGEDDRAVLAALYDIGVPLVVVATKVDKLQKSEVEPCLESIRQGLGLPYGQPLCVSSVTGEGTKELWRIVLEACEARIEEIRENHERVGTKNELKEEYETVPLDEEGNPLLFEDSEEMSYDQGYDWVHDTAVMYDRDVDDFDPDDEEAYLSEDEDLETDSMDAPDNDAFKLKNLKKRVRDMERRGEI